MGIRRLGGIVLGDPGTDELASLVEIDEQPLIAKLVPLFRRRTPTARDWAHKGSSPLSTALPANAPFGKTVASPRRRERGLSIRVALRWIGLRRWRTGITCWL